MRKFILVAVGSAALLVSAAASAAPAGKDSTVKGDKDTSGGGGGASSGGASTAQTDGAPSFDSARNNPDKMDRDAANKKAWEVLGGWEGHKLLRTNDLNGAAPDKYFNYYYATFRYDFDKYDRAEITAALYERFLADPEETGFRADDIIAAYTRFVPLPQKFDFSVKGSVLAPTSFVSYREGLITAPRIQLRLDKQFGKYVNVDFRTSGTYFIQRYNTSRDGTEPNERASVTGALESEVVMPFHTPLSAGAGLYTAYSWYLPASSTAPPEPGAGDPGVTQGIQQQPMQQTYGGEIYVRYRMPTVLTGLKIDAELALAQGDPTLGFTSALHDGESHYYLFYRQTSEVYAAITGRY